MFTKRSQIIAAVVLSVLLVILAGCGGSKPPESQGQGQEQETAAPKEPVKIGVVFPITGPVAGFGEKGLLGAQIAADQINKEGGILGGRQIELLIEDDEGNPESGTNAVRKLMREGVSAIVGTVNSSVALAQAAVTMQEKMLQVFVMPMAVNLRELGHPYAVFIAGTSDMEGEFYLKEYIANTIKPPTMVFLAENTDWGKSYMNTVENFFAEPGSPKIVDTQWFGQADTDFTVALTKVKGQNPDALQIVAGSPSTLAAILIQLEEIGYKGTVLASGMNPVGTDVINLAGSAAEGVYSLTTYPNENDTPENKQFVELYQAKHPGLLPELEVQGYEGMYILLRGMDAAGTDTDRDKIIEAIKANIVKTPRGAVGIDSIGQVQPTAMYILQVENGKNEVVHTITK